MNRRDFLKTVGVSAAVTALNVNATAKMQEVEGIGGVTNIQTFDRALNEKEVEALFGEYTVGAFNDHGETGTRQPIEIDLSKTLTTGASNANNIEFKGPLNMTYITIFEDDKELMSIPLNMNEISVEEGGSIRFEPGSIDIRLGEGENEGDVKYHYEPGLINYRDYL